MRIGDHDVRPGSLWLPAEDSEILSMNVERTPTYSVMLAAERSKKAATKNWRCVTAFRFETLADLHSHAFKTGYTDRYTFTKDFAHLPHLEAVRRLERDGWQEGADTIRLLSADLQRGFMGTGILDDSVRYGTEGQVPDVGRFVEGEPECMATFDDPRPGKGRIVDITINGAMSGDIRSEAYAERGIVVAALADSLERLGYRVRLTWQDLTGGYGAHGSLIQVVVKRESQPLDLKEVAYVMCHPSMLRVSFLNRLSEKFPNDSALATINGALGQKYARSTIWSGFVGGMPLGIEEPPLIRGLVHFGGMNHDNEARDQLTSAVAGLAKAGVVLSSDFDLKTVRQKAKQALDATWDRLGRECKDAPASEPDDDLFEDADDDDSEVA